MKTRNLFVYDHVNKAIIGTKTSLKKAGNPYSEEYKILTEMMNMRPDYAVKEKVIKENPSKKDYDGLNDGLIRDYLAIQKNAKELLAVYDRIKDAANEQKKKPFPLIKRWFLDTFKSFDVEKAKEEINKYMIKEAKEHLNTESSDKEDSVEENAQ